MGFQGIELSRNPEVYSSQREVRLAEGEKGEREGIRYSVRAFQVRM